MKLIQFRLFFGDLNQLKRRRGGWELGDFLSEPGDFSLQLIDLLIDLN